MPITARSDLMNPLLKEIRRNPALAVVLVVLVAQPSSRKRPRYFFGAPRAGHRAAGRTAESHRNFEARVRNSP